MIMEEEEEEMSTATVLPQEIIMDILSRLPANSLVSIFKLVCKGWCNLIKDPYFVKMHLIHGDGGFRRSLIWNPEIGNSLFQLYPPLNCDKSPLVFEDLPISVAKQLDFDLLSPSVYRLLTGSRLVGSCNGLLCLSKHERIILLNPSTRKYKLSPEEPIECPDGFIYYSDCVPYGFGCFHNSTTTMDEYKVVRIMCFSPDDNILKDDDDDDDDVSFPFEVNIYSMSSNSWRRVKGINLPNCVGHQSSGVFLNGVVHWMGCDHGGYTWDTIVSFNIGDEEFGQIPMAPCVDVVVHDRDDDMILMNWRGYLGMIYCSRTEKMDIDLEVWVMKEYGIGESWTKEFVIRTSDSDPHRELPDGFSIYSRHIMTYFWTGDQILIQGKYLLSNSSFNEWTQYGRLVLYDMNRKKINKDVLMVDIPSDEPRDDEPRDDQVDYIDTLVSLKSSLLSIEQQ